MRIGQLLDDYNVHYLTEGHKHCRPGWLNMPCPFCEGNPGYHLGTPLNGTFFRCWRCGWHPTDKTISKILSIDVLRSKSLIREYGGMAFKRIERAVHRRKTGSPFKFPSNIIPLLPTHAKYLEKRGFDPLYLQDFWKVQSTGVVSLLDKINYSKRIVYPIEWQDQVISFQTRVPRDTTHGELKYLTCPEKREIIPHKHVLYGNVKELKGICVEGVTDVWKLKGAACATFGIEFTLKQVRALTKLYSKWIVLYDDESQAQEQADKLVCALRFRGVPAKSICIEGDPGALSQDDADHLVKTITWKT